LPYGDIHASTPVRAELGILPERGAWLGTSNISGLGSVKNAFGLENGIVHAATNTI
jgi:hypothetical protein